MTKFVVKEILSNSLGHSRSGRKFTRLLLKYKHTKPDRQTLQNPSKKHVLNILQDFNALEKRCVIVDGCNVGFAHSNHQHFSVEGMLMCLNFFQREGYSALAIVPKHRASNNSNPSLLQDLCKQRRVLIAPYNDQDFGVCSDSYDDKCILSLAVRFAGAVVSNDNYRDLINNKQEWRDLIENRVIPFCFFKDMFIVPRDPYGPGRPSLQKVLTKTEKPKSVYLGNQDTESETTSTSQFTE